MMRKEKMTPKGLFIGFGAADVEPKKKPVEVAEKPLESEVKPAPVKRPGRPKKSV